MSVVATINGTSMNDTLIGTEADDFLYGLDGTDALFGRDGADHLSGGAGDDELFGEAGNDQLFGDDGDDRLFGGVGRDTLIGGTGNDRLDGGVEGDGLIGGAGDDVYVVDSPGDAVSELAGNGTDLVLALNGFHLPDNVENLTVTVIGGDGNTQYGSLGNASANIFIGIGAAFQFHGMGGDDRIYGAAWNDLFDGGAGNDVIEGGDGGDIYWIGEASHHVVAEFFDHGSSGIDEVRLASYAGEMVTLFAGDIGLERVMMYDTSALSIDASAVRNAMQLYGNMFANKLIGTAFADEIRSGDGADIMIGGAGDDFLLGDDGLDTALFSNLFRSYSVDAKGANGLVSSAAEGADKLVSVEILQFRDGKLVFDADGIAAQVTRLYDTVLQRAPDQAGLDTWVDRIGAGGTLKEVANGFLSSAEFLGRTGNLSNADYVEFLYRNALGRASDPQGKANWIELLSSGSFDRADVLIGFSESQEHRALTAEIVSRGFFDTDDAYQSVALLYDSFAGRLPDANGLMSWAEALKSGAMTLSQVASGFANSAEFQARTAGMSHSELVEFMYRNTLDRGSDPVGKAHWVRLLDEGMSDADLLLGFSQSNEHFILFSPHITNGIDFL